MTRADRFGWDADLDEDAGEGPGVLKVTKAPQGGTPVSPRVPAPKAPLPTLPAKDAPQRGGSGSRRQ